MGNYRGESAFSKNKQFVNNPSTPGQGNTYGRSLENSGKSPNKDVGQYNRPVQVKFNNANSSTPHYPPPMSVGHFTSNTSTTSNSHIKETLTTPSSNFKNPFDSSYKKDSFSLNEIKKNSQKSTSDGPLVGNISNISSITNIKIPNENSDKTPFGFDMLKTPKQDDKIVIPVKEEEMTPTKEPENAVLSSINSQP